MTMLTLKYELFNSIYLLNITPHNQRHWTPPHNSTATSNYQWSCFQAQD